MPDGDGEVVDELIVLIRAEFADIKKQVGGFKKEMGGATKTVKDESGKIQKAFGGITKGLNRIIIAAGAAVAAFVSFKTVIAGLNRVDSLAKTADKLGITTEGLQTLRFAAEQSGVAANTLDMALQRMTRRIAEAAQGTGEAKDAIKELGLSAQELARAGPEEAFMRIATAMSEVETQSDKVRLAFKLFDSEGVSLVNTLNAGADGIKAMGDQLRSIGGLISREEAMKVEEAKNALGRLGKVMENIQNQAAIGLAPAIETISNTLFKAAGEGEKMQDTFTSMGEGGVKVFGALADAVQGFRIAWAALRDLTAIVVSGILRSTTQLVESIVGAANFIRVAWSRTTELVSTSWEVAGNTILFIWKSIKETVLTALNAITTGLASMLYEAGNVAGFVSEDLEKEFIAMSQQVGRSFSDTLSTAQKETENARQALGESAVRAGEAIDAMFAPLDKIPTKWKENISGLKSLSDAASETRAETTKAFEAIRDTVMPSEAIQAEWDRVLAEIDAKSAEIAEKQRLLAEAQGVPGGDPIQFEKFKTEEILEIIQGRQLTEQQMTMAHEELLLRRRDQLNKKLYNNEVNLMRDIGLVWQSGFRGQLLIIDALGQEAMGILGNLSTFMESENRTMFNVGKAAAIAQGIIQTTLGAIKAFTALADIPIVGPALGAAAAAAAAAAGAANVAKIASTEFGGGGSASPVAPRMPSISAATSAAGGAGAGMDQAGGMNQGGAANEVSKTTNVNIALEGERFTDEQVRELISHINEQADDGAKLNLSTTGGRSML